MKLFDNLRKSKFLIAGPCVIENEEMCLELAGKIKEISEQNGFFFIFKASFDKANRTSINSYRGPGMMEGLRILAKVKETFAVPVVTDVHETAQVAPVAEVCDILQIPAFLCRQTDLLVAAGKTGRVINVKKGQFLSGNDMKYAADKIEATGNSNILLCERGNSFGYNNLVVDIRNLIDMRKLGYPVVMDVTHSTQRPGGEGGKSSGNREYAPYIAKAAAAIGVDGFFFEVHENPEKALSDGPNVITPVELSSLLSTLKVLFQHG